MTTSTRSEHVIISVVLCCGPSLNSLRSSSNTARNDADAAAADDDDDDDDVLPRAVSMTASMAGFKVSIVVWKSSLMSRASTCSL